MCEEIKIARLVLYFVMWGMGGVVVFFAAIFCKKKNININSFCGLIEMYRRVFAFENKVFSIVVIICVYGGALVGLFLFGITLWAEGRGCVFPTKYS
ncbi:hypothetical protein FZT81_22695 [Salmonella enterica subsp. enterica]|uniref:hypothetical protein n=1 Tax=Salmonella enterica TaxID=28901 RepID=UPI001275E4D6|nr:hypothetical protein [Salmonella enterica]EBU8435000.1 hypothetical protein [Salmonella enterica subsp. enterica serovar Ughelli]EBU8678165.1 hypothetical protein [Salmonella enterica subsp. enterica serovar Parkroyal]EBW0605235.1 hypothetical protein [Salmonella enterica subsp. enterica serovar Teddington]ECI3854033.1 hypothetical protein [Salmonella enterica subsp. enterica]ECQ6402281.1 hypothetical protein [Salmonella enterica subsp. enterica serovar Onireke]ECY8245652.1 hypothetical pr